jgi:hypothetical protein
MVVQNLSRILLILVSVSLFEYKEFFAKSTGDSTLTYSDYHNQIKDLYSQSLVLSKNIKDSDYSGGEYKKPLQEAISKVKIQCSSSFESQIYFSTQREYQRSEMYAYSLSQVTKDLANKRKEIYQKCKRMQGLLSRISFKLNQHVEPELMSIADIDNHAGIYNQTQHVYKELLEIRNKISANQTLEKQKSVIDYFGNYKDFDCDWDVEKRFYTNSKIFLKSHVEKSTAQDNKDRVRGIASSNDKFKYENMLNDLERRHVSFEKICEEIQHNKDKIHTTIKKLE